MAKEVTGTGTHGEAADAAAALYVGDVMHARLKPIGHRFSYRVMSLLIDLDRLDEADRQSRSVRRQPGSALQFLRGRSWRARRIAVASLCAALRGRARHRPHGRAGAAALLSPPARLHLQSALGLFWLSRRRRTGADDLRGAEYLRRHPSLMSCRCSRTNSAMPASGSNRKSCSTSRRSSRWRCDTISASRHRIKQVKLRILETDDNGPLLAATFNGRRRALNTRQLLRAFVALPMVTFKIMAAIHWEALRLWLKGARLVPRRNVAVDTGSATGNDYISSASSAAPQKRALVQ